MNIIDFFPELHNGKDVNLPGSKLIPQIQDSITPLKKNIEKPDCTLFTFFFHF